jgi:RNA polymerase sigma-70 factor, ECF subfamily
MPSSAPKPDSVSLRNLFFVQSSERPFHCYCSLSRLILPSTSGEFLELFAFDEAYLRRLREGDPSTEDHFVAYFSQLLQLKLRSRRLPPDTVDDLRQETFARVLRSIRSENGVREANRLGSFVNSVCNHVLLEFYRAGSKSVPLESSHYEIQDKVVNVEKMAITEQNRAIVRKLLTELPQRDQAILRAILDERSKDDICRQFGVSRDYLRVLVHRAKEKFRCLLGP